VGETLKDPNWGKRQGHFKDFSNVRGKEEDLGDSLYLFIYLHSNHSNFLPTCL
jgi:hypothetical protein